MTQTIVEVVEHAGDRVAATIQKPNGATGTLTVSADVPLTTDATPFVAASLLHAMQSGSELHVAGTVDRVAVDNARAASLLFSSWFRDFQPSTVTATEIADRSPTGAGVACFFSGGVDSFYSVLSRRGDITHLVFVHGFDIALDDTDLADRTIRELRATADALGLQLILVTTDMKEFADAEGLLWGRHYHGSALGAVAQLLAPHVSKVIVPASYHEDDLHPWGSHPDLDVLWDSGPVTIEHHGQDKTRPEKVGTIAQHQVALDHLRVCYLNPDGEYNCGRCEKCIRTIINLRVVGAAGRCKTLPTEVSEATLRGLRFDLGSALFARENLAEMKRRGISDLEVERTLRRAIRWGPVLERLSTVKRRLTLLGR